MNAPTTIPADPASTMPGNYFISNYPPFSCWNTEDTVQLRHVLQQPPQDVPLGLYVHLPFCRHRCHYCYFRVYPRRSPEDVNRYIDCVLRELELYKGFRALHERPPRTAYFGGGSPSYLSRDQIRRLLGGLQTIPGGWQSVEECTFECEPGAVDRDKFETLRQCGVTRISLGFQSLDDDILRRAGRGVTVGDCMGAFREARAAGFDEINIDLLAGLPGETEASWRRTVDQVLELMPDCITIYQLELTHNSGLLTSLRAGRKLDLPDWPTKRTWVAQAFEMCEQAGYTIGSGYMAIRNPTSWRFIYTVEHFWHGADLLALGETSFGHIQGVHYQNLDTFDAYTRSVEAGSPPWRRARRLSPEERWRRELILQLKTGVLDLDYFRKKYDVEVWQACRDAWRLLQREGLAEVKKQTITLTREGLLRVDALLPLFYLPEHRGIRYT